MKLLEFYFIFQNYLNYFKKLLFAFRLIEKLLYASDIFYGQNTSKD